MCLSAGCEGAASGIGIGIGTAMARAAARSCGLLRLALLLVCFAAQAYSQEETSASLDPDALCSSVSCHAGRECRVLLSGLPECVCIEKCASDDGRKKRVVRSVCGNDGVLYDSHCQMHREACRKGIHLRAVSRRRSCLRDPLPTLKRLVDEAAHEVQKYEMDRIQVPEACHQNERDRTREFIISWMQLTAPKKSWFTENMSYTSLVSSYWSEADSDGNGYVDAVEWMRDVYPKASKKIEVDNQRQMCFDALVEEADLDLDWRLDLQEFNRLLQPQYEPSNKYCVMDKKHYEDGTRTKVDCNGCVCSCGKWICTSAPCSELMGKTSPTFISLTEAFSPSSPTSTASSVPTADNGGFNSVATEEIFTYEDMDNVI